MSQVFVSYQVPDKQAGGTPTQAGEYVMYASSGGTGTGPAGESMGIQLDFSQWRMFRKYSAALTGTPRAFVYDQNGNPSTDLSVSGVAIGPSQTYAVSNSAVNFTLTNVNAGVQGDLSPAALPSIYTVVIETQLAGGGRILASLVVEVESPVQELSGASNSLPDES